MAQRVKNLSAALEIQEMLGLILGSGRPPRRRKWRLTPVFLPRKSYGKRSLVGYSPKGRKESHMSERLSTHSCRVINEMLCSNSGRREKEGNKV